MVEMLVFTGVPMNGVGDRLETPLHVAAANLKTTTLRQCYGSEISQLQIIYIKDAL